MLLASGGEKSQVTKETSASGSAAVGASSAFATPSVKQLLRIERRNVGGQFRKRQRKIAGDAHEGARAHEFALAHPREIGTRTIWRATLGSLTAASRSVL